MSGHKSDKILIRALKGERTERSPFWFMRQAGRYLPEYRALRSEMGGFWDLVFTPEKAAEVTLQPIERFGMDGAILFSDILVIPAALGQRVTFKPNIGPVLDTLDIKHENFGLSEDHIEERLGSIYETIRQVKARLPEGVTLIGFAGSPWTVATYMIESKGTPEKTDTIKYATENPERFQKLIDLIVKTTVHYLSNQIEAGAEALQLFDSWAGALKDEDMFRRWSIEPTREIIKALKAKYPEIPLIGFPKGAGKLYKPYFMETGLDALSIDYDVDLDWAARELQGLGCLQGNLNPSFLVDGGDALIDQSGIILEKLKKGPHVFNLGHGIVPETPPENVGVISTFLKTGV
ncbi:MAG: uroporphyrinogen decarboxylase [Sphingomonadales bacterium]